MTEKMTPEEAAKSIIALNGYQGSEYYYQHDLELVAEMIRKQRAQAVEEYKAQVSEVYPQMIYFPELLEVLGWQGGTIHQVIAEIKRLKEAEKASLWKPIEMAPKLDTYWAIVYFPCPTTGRMKVAEALYTGDEWEMLTATEMQYSIYPTHWMPLPAPPTDLPRCASNDEPGV